MNDKLKSAATVLDPVCGMRVDLAKAVGTSVAGGVVYAFCSRGCETSFDADPSRYITGQPQATSCCSVGSSCH